MTHNEALHDGTRKEIQFGFSNQLQQFSMTAKEISQMRANQSLVNGMVEVSEEFGKADEGK